MGDTLYKLIFDKEFSKRYKKLDNSLRREGDKKILKLKENPFGKPLKYFSNLFELHLQMYRIFYIVDANRIKILFIGVEHKDECDKYLKQLTPERINELIKVNL